MSPLEISILLHYRWSTEDFPGAFTTPAVRDAILRFNGELALLESNTGQGKDFARGYRLAPRGQAYVEAICSLPLPECKWVIPEPALQSGCAGNGVYPIYRNLAPEGGDASAEFGRAHR